MDKKLGGIGDSLRRPRSIKSNALVTGGLTSSDKFDFLRVKLTQRSSFTAKLTGLKANAKLSVLDLKGKTLAQSNKPGKGAELIKTVLDAGSFIVKVARVSGETRYRLKLDAKAVQVVTPGPSPSPITGSPSPSPSPGPSPTPTPTNTAPVLGGSLSLSAARGNAAPSSTNLGGTNLSATDAQQGPGQLTYTLKTNPAKGSLFKNGVALGQGGTFTQADIDGGLISYQQQAVAGVPDTTGITSIRISGSSAAWISGTGTNAEVYYLNGATGAVTRLTNDSLEDVSVNIDGNTVVWQTKVGANNSDIKFSLDGAAAVTLDSTTTLDDTNPFVSGSKIAFERQDSKSGNDGIFIYDTGTSKLVNTKAAPSSKIGGAKVTLNGISGSNALWTAVYGTGNAAQGDVYFSDGNTSKAISTSASLNDFNPIISGSKILFQRNASGVNNDGIFSYDLGTNQATKLTPANTDSAKLQLVGFDGTNAVWTFSTGSGQAAQRDIFFYNGTTATAIDNSTSFDDFSPVLSGSNLLFVRKGLGDTTSDGVYLYNTSTLAFTRLSTSATDVPAGLVGSNALWQSTSDAGTQLFAYDGTTTTDSFGFSVSDGSLSVDGTLNITIS
ncbi:MAG TPA: cadherin-like domain-containing protein [Crinalium sp.]